MISVHVAQLLKDEPGTRREIDFNDDSQTLGDVQLCSPLTGHADLARTNRGIFVELQYETSVRLTCGRCLDDFCLGVQGEFKDEILPPSTEPAHRDTTDEDDANRISPENTLDLSEIIRQEILLELPLQPLCRQDCPGLCPTCGVDLRTESCDCDSANQDNPFGRLAELLKPEK
jgi:uncharacterized protein